MNDLLGLAILLNILNKNENEKITFNNKELRNTTFLYAIISLVITVLGYSFIGFFENVFVDIAISLITGYFFFSAIAMLYLSIRATISILFSKF